jgi:hypothetical protein
LVFSTTSSETFFFIRTIQLFIDFKKAYDSVRREVLYNILIEFGIPMKLVRLIKMCLSEDKRFLVPNDSKHSPTSVCSQFLHEWSFDPLRLLPNI